MAKTQVTYSKAPHHIVCLDFQNEDFSVPMIPAKTPSVNEYGNVAFVLYCQPPAFRAGLLSNVPGGGKKDCTYTGTSPALLQLLFFFKTSLKTFLDLIYFPSQFQIGTGNKQYALCLLLSNLVCIVINLHNVSQTGLFSLMTPGTPFGIFVGKTSGVFQDRFPIV